MRYLSPTSISVFYKSREEFYAIYRKDLHKMEVPRSAQNHYMAIGSAFDAYVKSALFEKLYGKIDPKFSFEALFEAQVERHNRDKARVDGQECFAHYCSLGAFNDILIELQVAQGDVRFETTVEGLVGGVPMLGKPDIYYIDKHGNPIEFDFKVNGWYSSAYPKSGYVVLREQRGWKGHHKDCVPMHVKGVLVNACGLHSDWVDQLGYYGLLCGFQEEVFATIDQIVRSKSGDVGVATHRGVIRKDTLEELIKKAQEVWNYQWKEEETFLYDAKIRSGDFSVSDWGGTGKKFNISEW